MSSHDNCQLAPGDYHKKKVDYNDEGVVYLSLANLFSTAVRDTNL